MVNHPHRSKQQQAQLTTFQDKYEAEQALNAELLAALKRMIEAYREGVQDDREPTMVRHAIAIIAKCEGR